MYAHFCDTYIVSIHIKFKKKHTYIVEEVIEVYSDDMKM